MFGAFNTFGKLGSPAGGRSLLAQIQAMGASFIGIPSLSNYQDSAGTTLVTQPGAGAADPPVGLAIDLSQGAQLGPELMANYGFADGTISPFGSVSSDTVLAFDSGGARLTSNTAGVKTSSATFTSVAGKSYKIDFVCTAANTANAFVGINPGATIYVRVGDAVGVTKSAIVVATTTTTTVILRVDGASSSAVFDNISVRELKGNHALQSTSTARPKLSARRNLLVGTATLSTQSVTVTAAAHTIDWSGAGTITASGAYSGALSKGQTFTPSAGTLTLTVSGSVTSASLVLGSSVGTYQAVTDANNYDYAGWPLIHQFDGVDDVLNVTFPSSLGSDCTVVTANRGTTPTILTGQTIGTSYTINTTNAGRLVFPRALTAAETAIVTTWATKKGALPA